MTLRSTEKHNAPVQGSNHCTFPFGSTNCIRFQGYSSQPYYKGTPKVLAR